MDVVAERRAARGVRNELTLRIDIKPVAAPCEGVGKTIEQVRGDAVVVAVRHTDGRLEPQPAPASVVEEGQLLVAIGTPALALAQDNLELRRAACDMLGWPRILAELNAKTIDSDTDPQIGELVEVQLPDLPTPSKFLRVRCGTGREFAIGVPPQIATALDAQAWMVGLEPDQFERPDIRV